MLFGCYLSWDSVNKMTKQVELDSLLPYIKMFAKLRNGKNKLNDWDVENAKTQETATSVFEFPKILSNGIFFGRKITVK